MFVLLLTVTYLMAAFFLLPHICLPLPEAQILGWSCCAYRLNIAWVGSTIPEELPCIVTPPVQTYFLMYYIFFYLGYQNLFLWRTYIYSKILLPSLSCQFKICPCLEKGRSWNITSFAAG